MRKTWLASCFAWLISLSLLHVSLRQAAAEDSAGIAPAAASATIAAHAATFDFAEEWGETIDWARLDRVTRELAPDRLDWNALCFKSTGKPLSDFREGLPKAEAARFITELSERLDEIARVNHVTMTQNDWAIVCCAVVPMQAVKGSGQKYVTSLGDMDRLGVAIVKLVSTGVNCGDACALTAAILQARHIDCRFVGCHRKVRDPNVPAGHAMVEYFESNAEGRRFGHIVDVANISALHEGSETIVRPPSNRFQLIGDRLGRLRFLISSSFVHEQPALQGFDPPFTVVELNSPELADVATARWVARLASRSVVLDSTALEATVPAGKSILYDVTIGKDVPDGSIPMARMYRKGEDGQYYPLTMFSLHRRLGSNSVCLVWDRLLDELTPGDYRAVFTVSDPGSGFRRGIPAGEQIIHYGTKDKTSL